MKSSQYLILASACILGAAQWTASVRAASDTSYPIAGIEPFQRPANAPRIVTPPPLNKQAALYGVSEPVPASLKFLDDQGGWFNPFTHPGMTGPYDLRGWHNTSNSPKSTK